MKITHTDILAPHQTTCDNCIRSSDCLFHLPDRYGFKAPGHAAENVGYALVTDRAELHSAKKDFISCIGFVESLQDRMEFGAGRRRRGMDGEVVVLCGREGDEIEQHFEVGVNSRGEIVKPHPNQVEAMRASGYKVNVDDQNPPVAWKAITIKRKIPKLEAFHNGGSAYAAQVIAEAVEAEKHGFAGLASREAEAVDGITTITLDDDRPRRGRPPKVRDIPEIEATE